MSENTNQTFLKWMLSLSLIIVGLLILGCILFFGNSFLYGFGQYTAEQLAGVDETLTNMPTQTLTAFPVTETITPPSGPSLTPTFFYTIPTATATIVPWTTCPGIVISVNDTNKGDILHVLRCEDNYEYDIGPITKGAYAVSPDDKYLVYASVNGLLYAAKIGNTSLYTIANLKKDGPFVAFPKNTTPIFKLTFLGDTPPFVLKIYEAQFSQNYPLQMPN